MVVASFISSA
jgi:hypothetical protein